MVLLRLLRMRNGERVWWHSLRGAAFNGNFLPGVSAALRRPGYFLPTLRVGMCLAGVQRIIAPGRLLVPIHGAVAICR